MPLLFNWIEGDKTPPVSLGRLKELGFRLVIFPVSTLLAATRSIQEALARIRAGGSPVPVMDQLLPLEEFMDFIGMPEIRELEERFGNK